jgi:hypothetical protein
MLVHVLPVVVIDSREMRMSDEQRKPLHGFMKPDVPAGTTPSHDRPSFADPVPGGIDPTSPDSPEQTYERDRINPTRQATGERE